MIKLPGNIRLRIYPWFWIVAGLIGFLNSAEIASGYEMVLSTAIWVVIIFFSVLLHEFGHAITARAMGQKVQIELMAMGGLTHRSGPPLKLWQEFLIVFNGPLVGLLLAGLAYIGTQIHSTATLGYAIKITFLINLFWTVLNLLPIYPLDGGHLLRIILEGIFGIRGVKIALFFSMVFGLVIAVLFILVQMILVAAVFFILSFVSYQAWKQSIPLTPQDQNVSLQNLLTQAKAEMDAGQTTTARQKLDSIREKTKEGVIYASATEEFAKLMQRENRPQEAYELLSSVQKYLSLEGLMALQKLAFAVNKWQEAIALGDQIYQEYPNYATASVNALCYAVLGEVQPTAGWLQCAIEQGMPDPEEFLRKKEFDFFRSSELFHSIEKSLKKES